MSRLHAVHATAATILGVALLLGPATPAEAAPRVGGTPEAVLPVGVWPLDPAPSVVAPFAPPVDPWGAGHRGVDLAGRAGQVVRSALGGRVGFVGSIAGKPVVTVLHGGLRTTYEPVVSGLSRGDVVAAGDPIGRLVVPAGHCFPAACLHWGLLRGEVYLDPLSLVGGGPVRLLPLWREDPVREAGRWVPPLGAWRPPLEFLP